MGKAKYINRVNSFIPIKDYKLKNTLILGYDDILEDINNSELIEEKLSTKADLEDGKVIHSQIPSNVLLSDGSVQMGTQIQSILSNQYLIDSYTDTSINIEGDLRSIFNIGNYIKAYGAGVDYYMTILTVTYYSVQNYTKLTFVSQGTISYFFIIKISNIPTIYTPNDNEDIVTKRYADSKTLLLVNTQTVSSYDIQLSDAGKRIDMDWATYNNVNLMNDATVNFPIGTQIWIKQKGLGKTSINYQSPIIMDAPMNDGLRDRYSTVRLVKDDVNHWTLDGDLFTGHLRVGQKYLGGTIIKINNDLMSGVIASYNEFEANYTDALALYSVNGLYSDNGYSNWRLPTISELNLLLTHSKSERALIGDVNDDGIINNEDYALIEEGLYKDTTNPEWSTKWFRADVDGNGYIDGDDLNAVDNLINAGGGSIFSKSKYMSVNLSDVNPSTHCKGYSAPVVTIANEVITVVPHVLIEIPITDTVGVRLVRNF